MEGKRFVETERTYRLSSDVVRHGIDQSSSLSVHQSPLSQRCKHRKPGSCGKNLPGRQTAAFRGYCIPEPRFAPSFRAVNLLLVTARGDSLRLTWRRAGKFEC